MIEREYYRLLELVQRWDCTLTDLLHLGMRGTAQICVNYAGAGPVSDRDYEGFEDGGEPDEEKPWSARTLAPGLAQLSAWNLRALDQPGAFPYPLVDVLVWQARYVDGIGDASAWMRLTFAQPFPITPDHLCMTQIEVERVERDVLGRGVTQSANRPTGYPRRADVIGLVDLSRLVAQAEGMALDEATHLVATTLAPTGRSDLPAAVYTTNSEGLPGVVYRPEEDSATTYNRATTLILDVFNSRWWDAPAGAGAASPDSPGITREDAQRLFGVGADAQGGASSTTPTPDATNEYADDLRWPEELGIALTAWRAAYNGAERSGKRPGAFIREWLTSNYPNLSQEAIKRIATVANWAKQPGAARKE